MRRRREAERLTRDQQVEEPVPSISPDEAVDIGPQYILSSRQQRRWLEVGFDLQYSYTDNMFFNEPSGPTVGSTLLTTSAQIALTPPEWNVAQGKLKARAGYQYIWMNYALTGARIDPTTGFRKSDNDFDAPTASADLTETWKHWQAQVGVDWVRLLSHQPTYSAYSEFYRDYALRWSVSRAFELGRKHSLVAGYLGSHHMTHVDPTPGMDDGDRNDRTDHTLLLGYTYQIAPRLALQPGYRFQLVQYNHANRMDQLHTFTGGASFALTRWLFVRAYGAYELRESDDALVPDYRKWDVGVSLSAMFRF
ncbi:MAG: outer membrane beta-barrel protein [Verrucomicrobia bacterium]|nr:outer membrane beta-barrel protein [Verrucomicrobiota bacterium]MBI3867751.1 outer membrane beta-barrel protein [Verrucomicrobiota bacterium]